MMIFLTKIDIRVGGFNTVKFNSFSGIDLITPSTVISNSGEFSKEKVLRSSHLG